MTETQTRIVELFQTLAPEEQRQLAEQLFSVAAAPSFVDCMTPLQRIELDTAIAEADRDEGQSAEIVLDRIAAKRGCSRAEQQRPLRF